MASTPPNRLREFRERAEPKLSRNRLAHAIGVDAKTIYRIENGAPTSLATALAIARALSDALEEEVTVHDLFPESLGAPAEASV